ncbi:hypothetical protein [Nocardioides nanhaiensis]|uniref:Trp biosynthesis protein n=1 Tax=Nocardioides nanhaiensis TaxID=1476871 RepID=A0ABP8WR14_9ACTN
MPDLSTSAAPSPSRWRGAAVQAALIVALLALCGAAAGWVWHRLWAPAPPGVAVEGRWIPLPPVGSAAQFQGTGWFVVVAVATGVLVGVLVALLLSREELVSLAAVVVGSVLATWVMYRVGVALAPPDPAPVAAGAEDGTRLLGTLAVSGRSPFAALPLGALVGLALTYVGVHRPRGEQAGDPLSVRSSGRASGHSSGAAEVGGSRQD